MSQVYNEVRADGTSRLVGGLWDLNCQDRLRQWNDTYKTATDKGISEEFLITVASILSDAGLLLVKKQIDYGPTNISRAPGGPMNGLQVRMHDKIARINNLLSKDITPENESLRDSFIDLLNYSAIALMVLDNKWPR